MDVKEETTDYRLTERELNPVKCSGNMVKINEYEFIVPSNHTYDNQPNGIYIYNTKTNEWKLFLIYPSALKVYHPIICYNEETKILYLFCSVDKLITINLMNKEFEINIVRQHCPIGMYPNLFILNNQCHIIGGIGGINQSNYHYTQHLIWWHDDQQLGEIFNFEDWTKGVSGHGIIHITSQNEILLFGGYAKNSIFRTIWSFNTTQYEWKQLNNIKLPQNMHSFGYILSEDQRFCILFGGIRTNHNEQLSTIYIWDLVQMIFYESNIKTPSGSCYAVLMHNEKDQVLTYGYIRNVSKYINIDIPNELLKIIIMYHKTEYIHILNGTNSTQKKYHYKIDINDIINANKVQI